MCGSLCLITVGGVYYAEYRAIRDANALIWKVNTETLWGFPGFDFFFNLQEIKYYSPSRSPSDAKSASFLKCQVGFIAILDIILSKIRGKNKKKVLEPYFIIATVVRLSSLKTHSDAASFCLYVNSKRFQPCSNKGTPLQDLTALEEPGKQPVHLWRIYTIAVKLSVSKAASLAFTILHSCRLAKGSFTAPWIISCWGHFTNVHLLMKHHC